MLPVVFASIFQPSPTVPKPFPKDFPSLPPVPHITHEFCVLADPSTSVMYIEIHLSDVLKFPEVAFAFFLVTNRDATVDATAFALADFTETRAIKLTITEPRLA